MNMQAPIEPAIRTTCPYCGVGCGVLARADSQGGADISGDPAHPANYGKLCSKGSALGETLTLRTRLLHPMIRGEDGELARASWDEALDKVAEGFRTIAAEHGPGSVAFYLSGQLLTEDYYVANKLMKGFIGSANVDTNSRLCMASTVAAQKRAFGSDTVPGNYEDLDRADLIVLVGSNTAWCHPVLFRRMVENRERHGAKIVVIDPRRTATAEEADLFLAVAPGMDTVLFAGLLAYLADSHRLDFDFIARHTDGFEPALARAREIAPSVERVAERTGLARKEVIAFYELFAGTRRTVTAFSQGVNQSAQGTDKASAIINCHLATGRIGHPGMGPFSLTGQPNAMGGREVGGLANQLAAHMGFTAEEVDRVQRFWSAPNIVTGEGLKAVQMFEAIERGEIKALWVMATNPAVSLPRADAVAGALGKLELLVVSENVLQTDTVTSGAHVLLPAAAWGEKDGTVTNSERRISRQRAFLALPGEAKPDWQIVCEVARSMGFAEAFSYSSAAAIFREHAALSSFENNGSRDFDIGAMKPISEEEYEALEPFQWPHAHRSAPRPRLFDDGAFSTPGGRAKFIAPQRPVLAREVSDEFPLVLNTGRLRDQWHTMTRTGLSPRLANHAPEPFVAVNPEDAGPRGLNEGGFARIRSAEGEGVYRVRLESGQRPGSVFVPIHWSRMNASGGRTGALIAAATDPLSGQPEAKATPVAVEPVSFAFTGFVLSSEPLVFEGGLFWTRIAVARGEGAIFAGDEPPSYWRDYAARNRAENAEVVEYSDEQRDTYRVAHIVDGRIVFSLFVGRAETEGAWDTIRELFAAQRIAPEQRRFLLSGKMAGETAATGPVICACFGVGLATIRQAIEAQRLASVSEIGLLLRAGTNCGSCKPELKRILNHVRNPQTV